MHSYSKVDEHFNQKSHKKWSPNNDGLLLEVVKVKGTYIYSIVVHTGIHYTCDLQYTVCK